MNALYILKKSKIIALMISMMLMSGYRETESTNPGTGQSVEAESAETVETTESAVQSAPTDFVSDELMAQADRWQSCDDSALASVMRKAEAGEKVTICCIGGSITQGTISNGTSDAQIADRKCYADIFFSWWQSTFPDTEFTFINAGIGATDSYIGVHRVQEDVLDYHPDLVLVEFSVNDANEPFFRKTYDNLVRRIAKSDSNPAVMLLFMGQLNGATSQERHVLVGYAYELPMISYFNVQNVMLKNNIYTAPELSSDGVHPSVLGHAIIGEILWKYLNSVYVVRDDLAEPKIFDHEPLTEQSYANAVLWDCDDIAVESLGSFVEEQSYDDFPNSWVCHEGEGVLTVTLECRNLGILYCKETDGTGGQFDIFIDDEWVQSIDADFTGGWGRYADAKQVLTSEEESEHRIVIKKADTSTGDVIAILGFLIS